mgnify:CR=1 FL=1
MFVTALVSSRVQAHHWKSEHMPRLVCHSGQQPAKERSCASPSSPSPLSSLPPAPRRPRLSKGRKDYLVEVYGNCFNLDQAQQLAVDSTTSCLGKGDHIITSDSIAGFRDDTGFGVQRCMVKSIHEWDSKASKPTDAEETE